MGILALFVISCGSNDDDTTILTQGSGVATIQMKADFSTQATSINALHISLTRALSLPKINTALKQAVCPTPAPMHDDPTFAAGLDCDQDGGVVSYLTPSKYRVSIKRLSFISDSNETVDIIADSGTLAAAPIVDLTSTFTLPAKTLAAGNYSAAKFEFYFVELTMPINNADTLTTLRIYLSDDDFINEGSLGHHQGDITFIDATSGDELGFVLPGESWNTDNLGPTRTVFFNSSDSQSGHKRGLFGNTALWDQVKFQQGADQDIFIYYMPLNLTVVADGNQAVTINFPVKDTWYFEDFDGDNLFGPCLGASPNSDACADNAEWAPLFNPPKLADD